MEITGTIIVALPEVSGISKSTGNPWKKREYVLENTDGQYPRKMCFTCFGDNADRINLTVGQRYTVSFDIDAHEYNGRWFNEIRAWRAVDANVAAQAPVNAAPAPAQTAAAPAADLAVGSEEEFPF